MIPVGGTIKRLRIERGLTQDDLARRLGVQRTTVASWERNARVPQIETARKLAEMFHVPLSVIVPEGNTPKQYASIGRRLEELFDRFSASFDEDTAKEMGVDFSSIQNCLESDGSLTFEEMVRIADYFGVTLDTVRGETRDIVMVDPMESTWTLREELRRDPARRTLLSLAQHGASKDVEQVAALIDALRATNPDFYNGDDPA